MITHFQILTSIMLHLFVKCVGAFTVSTITLLIIYFSY